MDIGEIIDDLEGSVTRMVEYGDDLEACSFGMQEGVLIPGTWAQAIVDFYRSLEPVAYMTKRGAVYGGNSACRKGETPLYRINLGRTNGQAQ